MRNENFINFYRKMQNLWHFSTYVLNTPHIRVILQNHLAFNSYINACENKYRKLVQPQSQRCFQFSIFTAAIREEVEIEIDNDQELPDQRKKKEQETKKKTYKKPSSYKKPSRPCPFCHRLKTNLTEHLKRKHRNKPEVENAFKLPTKDRIKAVADLRKLGILKTNLKMIQECPKGEKPELIRERSQGDNNIVYCTKCYGFFSQQFFYRHKRLCMLNDSDTTPTSIPTHALNESSLSEPFKRDILKSFMTDEVGTVCVNDPLIIRYSERKYNRIMHKDKMDEKRKSLKTDMRRIGKLYCHFREKCSEKRSAMPFIC